MGKISMYITMGLGKMMRMYTLRLIIPLEIMLTTALLITSIILELETLMTNKISI